MFGTLEKSLQKDLGKTLNHLKFMHTIVKKWKNTFQSSNKDKKKRIQFFQIYNPLKQPVKQVIAGLEGQWEEIG